jgi:TPR repeat protein
MSKTFTGSVLLALQVVPALGQQLQQYRIFDAVAKSYVQAALGGASEDLARSVQKHLNGEGVPQDYGEFAKRVSVAAETGDQWAQLMLGLAYYAARGVPPERVLAHMWSNIAAAGGDPKIAALAKRQRDELSAELSRGELARSQALMRARTNTNR